jgi:hypothetical protein
MHGPESVATVCEQPLDLHVKGLCQLCENLKTGRGAAPWMAPFPGTAERAHCERPAGSSERRRDHQNNCARKSVRRP